MSRFKRAKKQSNLWAIVLVIVCLFVVGGTFYILHDITKKVDKIDTTNISDFSINENTIQNQEPENNTNYQNIISENNTIDNKVKNATNNATNTFSNNVVNTIKNNSISNTPAIPAITDDKQKAIELVENEWGVDDTVSFSFEYINEKGEYVVAVKDRIRATVRCYFRVNLTNNTVELD